MKWNMFLCPVFNIEITVCNAPLCHPVKYLWLHALHYSLAKAEAKLRDVIPHHRPRVALSM